MGSHHKVLLCLNILIALLLVYFIATHSTKESLTTDDVAGSIPAALIPDMNQFAAHDVRANYLPFRGWRFNNNPRWIKDTSSVECPYNSNNPIKGGDMKHNPNEIKTVINGSEVVNTERKIDTMIGHNNEAPAFWEPVEFLDDIGFYHNVDQGKYNKNMVSYTAVQEQFTTDQLLAAANGRNVLNA